MASGAWERFLKESQAVDTWRSDPDGDGVAHPELGRWPGYVARYGMAVDRRRLHDWSTLLRIVGGSLAFLVAMTGVGVLGGNLSTTFPYAVKVLSILSPVFLGAWLVHDVAASITVCYLRRRPGRLAYVKRDLAQGHLPDGSSCWDAFRAVEVLQGQVRKDLRAVDSQALPGARENVSKRSSRVVLWAIARDLRLISLVDAESTKEARLEAFAAQERVGEAWASLSDLDLDVQQILSARREAIRVAVCRAAERRSADRADAQASKDRTELEFLLHEEATYPDKGDGNAQVRSLREAAEEIRYSSEHLR